MGSPPTERDRDSDESAHDVRLSRGFAMMDRLVTRDQYQRFLAETRGEAAARGYLDAVVERSPAGLATCGGFQLVRRGPFLPLAYDRCGLPESEHATTTRDFEVGTKRKPGRRPMAVSSGTYRLSVCRPRPSGNTHAGRAQLRPTVSAATSTWRRVLAGSREIHAAKSTTGRCCGPIRAACETCTATTRNGAMTGWPSILGPGGLTPPGRPTDNAASCGGGSYLSRPALARSASRSGLPPTFASPSAGLRVVRTLSSQPLNYKLQRFLRRRPICNLHFAMP